MVFDEMCLCWHIQSSEYLSHFGKVLFSFDFNSSRGWELKAFLLVSRRWRYSTDSPHPHLPPPLFPKGFTAVFGSTHFPPSTCSSGGITEAVTVIWAGGSSSVLRLSGSLGPLPGVLGSWVLLLSRVAGVILVSGATATARVTGVTVTTAGALCVLLQCSWLCVLHKVQSTHLQVYRC